MPVREMGLEPTRQRHWNLNPARLPIPPLARAPKCSRWTLPRPNTWCPKPTAPVRNRSRTVGHPRALPGSVTCRREGNWSLRRTHIACLVRRRVDRSFAEDPCTPVDNHRLATGYAAS